MAHPVHVVEPIEPLPLGQASPHHIAERRGRALERLQKLRSALAERDWHRAWQTSQEVLRTDTENLEAAWLSALSAAALGKYERVVAPLSQAVAGDWMKWGERSLTDPDLQEFLQTPQGIDYRSLQQHYRQRVRASLARALLVIANATSMGRHGEVYAYDRQSERFIRLTHTDNAVVGYALAPDRSQLLYVARTLAPQPIPPRLAEIHVGIVDLENARIGSVARFTDIDEIRVSYGTPISDPANAPRADDNADAADPGTDADNRTIPMVRIRTAAEWRNYLIDSRPVMQSTAQTLRATPDAAASAWRPQPGAEILHVTANAASISHMPTTDIVADWDSLGTAGAFRIEHSRKTVTLARQLSAYRSSIVWSPSRKRLAFIAMPVDFCAVEHQRPPVHLYVVDAATAVLRPLRRAERSFAAIWLDDDHLALTTGGAEDAQIDIVDAVAGETVAQVQSPGGVSTRHILRPRQTTQCIEASPPPSSEQSAPPVPKPAGPTIFP